MQGKAAQIDEAWMTALAALPQSKPRCLWGWVKEPPTEQELEKSVEGWAQNINSKKAGVEVAVVETRKKEELHPVRIDTVIEVMLVETIGTEMGDEDLIEMAERAIDIIMILIEVGGGHGAGAATEREIEGEVPHLNLLEEM